MRRIASAAMSSDGAFLEAAAAIGRTLTADAIWHEGRCSWVGAFENQAKPWRADYRALGGDLYDGTAGVGLFLAHLAAVTGSEEARGTAIGAIRHAVERPGRREGLHVGSLGIAWAAAHAARVLDDDELLASARARTVAARPVIDGALDVVFGSAGSLIARLGLADALDEPGLVADAVADGERLLAAAAVTRHGWSWPSKDRRHRRHLCGLSHGAGGIGWALLELYAATGDERYRTGASGAFAYECSWLDRDSGTWPDLRIGGQRRGAAGRVPSPAIGTWCHGEGGIALTRVRAADLLGQETLAEDAVLALDTTARELAAAVPFDIEDLTLCHGAAGAADVLISASGSAEGLPEELGRIALARHDFASRDWPSGLTAGTTPALFQGLSGIGWWFLRLSDPAIQSPLTMPIRLTPVRATA
jgi:lantibiotic modifying enzyme